MQSLHQIAKYLEPLYTVEHVQLNTRATTIANVIASFHCYSTYFTLYKKTHAGTWKCLATKQLYTDIYI